MSEHYARVQEDLSAAPRLWLITGVAGFIGSHLLETLLELGQAVVGLDNFSTGREANLEDVRRSVSEAAWNNFRMVRGDIRDAEACAAACRGVDIADPAASNASNVDGFVRLAAAAREAGARRMVYASSSAVYGDSAASPKREEDTGRPLSPYAVTKVANELYAGVFSRLYPMELVGLRYFNVFGARQDPEGPYAAVIPRWIQGLLSGRRGVIFGDGKTTRDFCYVANAVQANIMAGVARDSAAVNRVYNVSFGEKTTLAELYQIIRTGLEGLVGLNLPVEPDYQDFRAGDIRHSLADISAARTHLHYEPSHSLRAGMQETLAWYVKSRG
jgi:UDP-N-acetylglucosamine/UDP-N-acetylgalactosamine 4-epimerase